MLFAQSLDYLGADETFLHFLAENGSSRGILSVLDALPRHVLMRLLVVRKADGGTALHHAARRAKDRHMTVALMNFVLTRFSEAGMSTFSIWCHSFGIACLLLQLQVQCVHLSLFN